jgi:hypothetical protein
MAALLDLGRRLVANAPTVSPPVKRAVGLRQVASPMRRIFQKDSQSIWALARRMRMSMPREFDAGAVLSRARLANGLITHLAP